MKSVRSFRSAPRVVLLCSAATLLSSCTAWQWTKDKLGMGRPPEATTVTVPSLPPATPAPAPAAGPVSAPAPVLEPVPVPAPLPLPQSSAIAATPLPSEPPRAQMAPSPPSSDLARGRYAVQVGVFLVAANAETIRARVATQLAADNSLDPAERVVRSVKKGDRTYVVVGDARDRAAAESLAQRVRAALRQDVAIFQR